MKKFDFNKNWTCNGSPAALPHDAMILGKRLAGAPGGSAQGFFPGGSYTYEKTFVLPAAWAGQPVKLEFEGVYKNSKVFVNGTEKGGAAYGYIPFFVDCGVLPEGKNTVTVTCENADQPDSRWYSGAGIYRPVWAWVGEGITAADVRITTVSVSPAKVAVTVCGREAQADIYDGDSRIASGTGEIEIPDAKLWSAENPHLYTCRVLDQSIRFGIRQLSWSSRGFFVNGKETLLRGGCIHHDNGILGSVSYDESEWRKIRILKKAGFNAIRSAHNPCSRAVLEACDALGMYVMDESWDMWFHHKNPYDYASVWKEHYLSDLEAMVRRDFNHPSVIMYSIGNEVSEPAKKPGIAAEKEMVEYLHRLDPTRPITGGFNLMIIKMAGKGKGIYDDENGGRKDGSGQNFNGMNSAMFNLITSMVGTGMNKAANGRKADEATSPSLDLLDIAGYNYASGRYPGEGKLHPDRVIVGSETFPNDIAKNWSMVRRYPYLIGDFMWTAWDYLGEAGIGAWAYTSDGKNFNKPYPWMLADVGAFDILGNPNGEAFLASAVWHALDKPAIAVQPVNHPGVTPSKGSWRGTNAIPSWSWRGCGGNKAVVEVYFDCAKTELFLNGKSLGRKTVKGCKAVFKTRYVPGKLVAVAFDSNGNEIARNELASAKTFSVHAVPEKSMANVGDIIYVPVTIGDGRNVESNADRTLTASVQNGELLAFGSANPRTEEPFHSGKYTTYYGHALAVVRAVASGTLTLCIDGTPAAEIRVVNEKTGN
ncbi:MAG: glycoside hydrolase family 2 TIM barrel-domain containing protein [Lachnospiraceae bacterium]